MKKETAVIAIRGGSAFFVPFFATWTAALAQWVGGDNSPPSFIWWAIVIPSSLGAGWKGLDSFFSGAWQAYLKNGNSTENQVAPGG